MTHSSDAVAGLGSIGLSALSHTICCGFMPAFLSGVAQTSAAGMAHAHDGLGFGTTVALGALTTAAVATGMTMWQQKHARDDKKCDHDCAPHLAEQKKAPASWGKVWLHNAAIGGVAFVAMHGLMHVTDFNREKQTIWAQPETQQVLVVDESQTVWGLWTTHRHYQTNSSHVDDYHTNQGLTRMPLETISEEFGDTMRETLSWEDVTEMASIDSVRSFCDVTKRPVLQWVQ